LLTVAQRRARVGVRHHLATRAKASTVVGAVEGVVALHSTDPASVFLSLFARTRGVTPEAIEAALYTERTLLRMLGMRRTMFVVPTGFAPVLQAACTRAIAVQNRKRYIQLLEQAGVGDAAFLAEVSQSALDALERRGEATGAQLSTDEPRLRTAVSSPYGSQNITTWVLFQLAADGLIVRGRPRGTWTSSQYHWSAADVWLPDGIAELPAAHARTELVRAWLAAFGPGTVADLRWWTGWTAAHVKAALTEIQPSEVDLEDGTVGLVLPGDEGPVKPPPPWVALLPALDPTAMGWSQRAWYVGEHAPLLFDRSGNIGPTVWCDGRIVGGWAQRPDGEVVVRLLEDIGTSAAAQVEQEAARLTTWIGDVRVTPRFRTPLERELATR
jgi:Winged helix DNA-binding domain